MSKLATLKAATSLNDVAMLLDFKPAALSYILYKQPASAKYITFNIPKRSGGSRTIKAPVKGLKVLQRKLSHLLQDCIDELNVINKRKDRVVHGFKRNRSIITNGRRHRHRRWVFNLDLEDFFPSINFGRVRGYFLKNRDFLLQPDVATVLAQIACHENSLPQGSPCSPVVSNLVASVLDMRLVKLATETGCTYSRYADDLTFSTNKKAFPASIATTAFDEGTVPHIWLPAAALRKIVERSGFKINDSKTHMMYRVSRQTVTGLVVNEKINTRCEYRRVVRAMVHSLVTTGEFEVCGVTHKNGKVVVEKRPGTLNELHGMLGFIDSINIYNGAATSDPEGMSSQEKVYRQFLIYSTFYAAQTPVVVCEGDTDNVYLTHAIRSLAGRFPDLAEVRPDGTIRLKVRLYKYPRTSTARLLGLAEGGSGVLSGFIAAYAKETKGFEGPGLENPILIVYDNDNGAKGIRNAIKEISKVAPVPSDPFVHITKNMYAVPTPLAGGGASKIEDFFDAATKAIVIAGKTFDDGNSFDPKKHYGKKVFAHKVVRPNADTIDFTAFRPLLTNLVAAIKTHTS